MKDDETSPTMGEGFDIDGSFGRTELLIGSDAMGRISAKRVILFGVGGVGSWCAEALIRSGFRHLTMVDFDRVNQSNINRQLPATQATVGQPKVEVMRRRLLEINPEAEIEVRETMYTDETADTFRLEEYDYVIDAIDSVADKALLICRACDAATAGTRLFSSMGAALKTDPARVAVAEFWKVRGCRLAAALRHRFKRSGQFPCHRFKCVYSDELVPNRMQQPASRKPVNGTLMHITAIFGLTLASLVISDSIR